MNNQSGVWVDQEFETLDLGDPRRDRRAAHVDAAPHGQRSQPALQLRKRRGSARQPLHDRVGAAHHVIPDPVRISASAAGILVEVGQAQFGLDVAAGGVMGKNGFVDAAKRCRRDVEPVKVAVEDQVLPPALRGKQLQHRRQRLFIAVQAADHVQDVRLGSGRRIEQAWRVAVGRRTAASCAHIVSPCKDNGRAGSGAPSLPFACLR
ncbi:MAG: hypothetical protein EOO80_04555 [Oxalobacteraceae bacterium]|nr:MAG: hypothetical protein EOO80_04555 [Oxalobacteraceae bacterium]